MIETILFALWFFLPAGIANMAPVPISKISVLKQWNAPMDFGVTWRGRRLFGAHKTWRGLFAGIIAAAGTVWLQQYLTRKYGWFAGSSSEFAYLSQPWPLLGLALAVGALGGDAIKSFFKRRRDIKPGSVWLPFDLIDHIIGAAFMSLPFVVFDWWVYLVVVAVWPFANLAISYAGYCLRIKERPF